MTLLLLLAACSDTGLHTHEKEVAESWPGISVTPERLDFWDAGPGEVVVLPMTVWSVGDTALRVESVAIDGAQSFSIVDGGEGFDLLPGESREIEVSFAPLEPGDQAAEALVTSDDPDYPEVRVPLAGGGVVPSLVVTPETWDFGALPAGCSDQLVLTLQNVGTADLDVTSWTYTGDGFSIVGEREPPFTLAPYGWTSATVTFAPGAEGAVTGELAVTSNDPRGVVVATQDGEGTVGSRGHDTFTSEVDPPVDIVFAVDQSTSMDDDAEGLAAAFTTFIDTLGRVTSGWRIGVVTMDDGCFNGGVLEAGTTSLTTSFSDAVAYGEDLEIVHDEALFQVFDAALQETAAGGCNEGFLRDGAPLHVIFVSDEPERSAEEASAWTWDWYLSRWTPYVASDSLLRVSGIVDTDGCNEGAAGYSEAISATGGDALSICSGDWADRLSTLASASLEYARTFELSAEPVPASIGVQVDGASWSSGWSYDAGLNAVVIVGLEPGATVDVAYDLASTCP